MKIKAGNDERVWLFFKKYYFDRWITPDFMPSLDGADQLI